MIARTLLLTSFPVDLRLESRFCANRIGDQTVPFRLLKDAERAFSVAAVFDHQARTQGNVRHHQPLTFDFFERSLGVGIELYKFEFRVLRDREKRRHEARVH